MNWCVILAGGLIGVGTGLIRLAWWMGWNEGHIQGFTHGWNGHRDSLRERK